MRFIGKLLVSALAALVASWVLPGVSIDSGTTAFLVALVLALLNSFVKPILVLLTIPITVVTLGLFLLVINTVIVIWTEKLVPGFSVNSWFTALLFSLLLSVVTALIEALIGDTGKNRRRD